MVFPILGSGSQAVSYDIEKSLRFDGVDARFVGQTSSGKPFNSAGNRQTWTCSFWIKFSKVTTTQHFLNAGIGSTYTDFYIHHSGTAGNQKLFFYAESSGSQATDLETTRYFRDPFAWYHLVLAVDTTQGTASNRVKIYVNGVQETAWNDESYPSQNYSYEVNNNVEHHIGPYQSNGSNFQSYFDGYMSDFYLIDGTQYAASDFGEFDNDSAIWKPKEFTGTFGAKGVFLEFKQTGSNANASGRGADTSGNGNHWGFAGHDNASVHTTDTPTNNFCTLNPIAVPDNLSDYTSRIAEGALELSSSTVADSFEYMGTMPTNMKYYFECKLSTVYDNNGDQRVGIVSVDKSSGSTSGTGAGAGAIYGGTGSISSYNRAGGAVASTLTGKTTFADGQIIGVAVDNTTNNDVKFYNNGVLQGTIDIVSTELYMPYFRCMGAGGQTNEWHTNFGNPPWVLSSGNTDANGYGNFEYEPPSGYYALCTKNLAEYG